MNTHSQPSFLWSTLIAVSAAVTTLVAVYTFQHHKKHQLNTNHSTPNGEQSSSANQMIMTSGCTCDTVDGAMCKACLRRAFRTIQMSRANSRVGGTSSDGSGVLT
eukprot:PhF_6_TR10787/c2_g1_i1/m.17338